MAQRCRKAVLARRMEHRNANHKLDHSAVPPTHRFVLRLNLAGRFLKVTPQADEHVARNRAL
jgi:hypothetical protein